MHMNDDGLDKVKRGLYSRKGIRFKDPSRDRRTQRTREVPTDWEEEQEQTRRPRYERAREKPRAKKEDNGTWRKVVIIGSAVIFLAAVGTFVYRFAVVGGLFSPHNVTIEIDAPHTAGSGEEVRFRVSVQNENRTPIHNARLAVEFPEGTYAADESGSVLDSISRTIGTIEPQGTTNEQFEIFLFGEEGGEVTVDLALEYTTISSSATLTKESSYDVSIVSAPALLTIDPSLTEVQSGNEFEIDVEVASNTSTSLQDLILTAEYPGGFSLLDSNPAPIERDHVWDIGSLEPRETKEVTLRGTLEGQDGEERFITFNVGAETDEQPNSITRLFARSQQSFEITEPPLILRTMINKDRRPTVSVPAGARVNVEIDWENTLSDRILNLALEAVIDTSRIEEESMDVERGFYRSSDETIVWDQTTDNDLDSVSAGVSGTVSFSFVTEDFSEGSGSNVEIPLRVQAEAREEQSGSATRTISNEITREIRIASDLLVSQTLTHRDGVFENTGPTPPRANEITTYTVTWRVASPANDVEDAVVRAALPTYVEFVEAESGTVSVNELTNEVMWRAGEVSGERGFGTGAQEVSFQIEFEASESQIGEEPILIREVLAEGRDAFSGDTLRGSASSLTTDSLLESGAGPVVE